MCHPLLTCHWPPPPLTHHTPLNMTPPPWCIAWCSRQRSALAFGAKFRFVCFFRLSNYLIRLYFRLNKSFLGAWHTPLRMNQSNPVRLSHHPNKHVHTSSFVRSTPQSNFEWATHPPIPPQPQFRAQRWMIAFVVKLSLWRFFFFDLRLRLFGTCLENQGGTGTEHLCIFRQSRPKNKNKKETHSGDVNFGRDAVDSQADKKLVEIVAALEDEDSDTIHYVMLRGVNRFHSEYNRYPGSDRHSMEADIPKLKVTVLCSRFSKCFLIFSKWSDLYIANIIWNHSLLKETKHLSFTVQFSCRPVCQSSRKSGVWFPLSKTTSFKNSKCHRLVRSVYRGVKARPNKEGLKLV